MNNPTRLALIGTGLVGKALIPRLDALCAASDITVGAVARSTGVVRNPHAKTAQQLLDMAQQLSPHDAVESSADFLRALCTPDSCTSATCTPATCTPATCTSDSSGQWLVIDATASDEVAAWHAPLLAADIPVVTANKRGLAGSLDRWHNIATSRQQSDHVVPYGSGCVVGAGLPLVKGITRLRRSGEDVTSLHGVLSGSLAVLLSEFDGSTPFATLVEQAVADGLCEPDAWEDLSGVDVERKLLVLSRAAGYALTADKIERTPLYVDGTRGDWEGLSRHVESLHQQAAAQGLVLAYTARLMPQGSEVKAIVGPEFLSPDHLLASGGGVNTVAIHSTRYCDAPLVIQGPGAGPDVTAAGLLDDIIEALNVALPPAPTSICDTALAGVSS